MEDKRKLLKQKLDAMKEKRTGVSRKKIIAESNLPKNKINDLIKSVNEGLDKLHISDQEFRNMVVMGIVNGDIKNQEDFAKIIVGYFSKTGQIPPIPTTQEEIDQLDSK